MKTNPPRLVVGLGNPTAQYDGTYHNIGFFVLDKALEKIGAECAKNECSARTAHALIDGHKVVFAKPETYMNLSGTAVRALMQRYKIPPENILVICDDIDLPCGTLRFRKKGSGGTHNGLRDIVLKVGEEFNRLRFGIGRPETAMNLADYVLSKIKGERLEQITASIPRAVDGVISFGAGETVEQICSSVNG